MIFQLDEHKLAIRELGCKIRKNSRMKFISFAFASLATRLTELRYVFRVGKIVDIKTTLYLKIRDDNFTKKTFAG